MNKDYWLHRLLAVQSSPTETGAARAAGLSITLQEGSGDKENVCSQGSSVGIAAGLRSVTLGGGLHGYGKTDP